MHRHPNRETAAASTDLVGRWDDIWEDVTAWLAEDHGRMVTGFARQLRADFRAYYAYAFADEPFLQNLVRAGLARIDWTAVALHLLALAARQQLRSQTRDVLSLLRDRARRTV